jgi:hypothetical protein
MSLQELFKEDLRAIVTTYPLASLILAVMVAVPVLAIAAWVYRKRVEHLRVAFAAEKAVAESALRDRISQLQRNYSKVVVEVGQSNLVWDHLGTLVPKSEVLQLSAQQFRGYLGGSYYLANFDQGDWQYKRCTRLDFLRMVGLADLLPPPFVDMLGKIECDTWFRPAVRKENIDLLNGDTLELNIFPYVLVQRTNAAQLRGAGAAMLGETGAEATNSVRQIADQRPEAEREIKDTLKALENLRKGDGHTNASNGARGEVQREEAAESLLDRLMNHELATMILADNMTAELAMSRASANVTYNINSLQKKGNIFVLDSEKQFKTNANSGSSKQHSLRELLFFIGGYPDSLVVNASIPSSEGLSEDVPWIGEWLTNLRVPI